MPKAIDQGTVSLPIGQEITQPQPFRFNPDAILRAYRRRDARRSDRRDRTATTVHAGEPWPVLYDPPSFPYLPGHWPDALRRAWQLWIEAWDDVAADMELESAGLLWQCYNAMTAAGVIFDPRFVLAFESWRHRAELEFEGDRDDDPDEDVSVEDYTVSLGVA